jgi:hypothetical protein
VLRNLVVIANMPSKQVNGGGDRQMAKRYRIHFVASFDRIIDAETIAEAHRVANELQTMPNIAMCEAGDVRCAWNTIEPLTDEDPV